MPSQQDIDHQLQLLRVYRGHLEVYINQYARHGSNFVPPSVVLGIKDQCGEIRRVKQILASWSVPVDDKPDDDYDIFISGGGSTAQTSRSTTSGPSQQPEPSAQPKQPPPAHPPRMIASVVGALRLVLVQKPRDWALIIENYTGNELSHVDIRLYPSDVFVSRPSLTIPILPGFGRSYEHLLGLRQSSFCIPVGVAYRSSQTGPQQFDMELEVSEA